MCTWRFVERREHRGNEDSGTHWGSNYTCFTSLRRLEVTVITLYFLRSLAGDLHQVIGVWGRKGRSWAEGGGVVGGQLKPPLVYLGWQEERGED